MLHFPKARNTMTFNCFIFLGSSAAFKVQKGIPSQTYLHQFLALISQHHRTSLIHLSFVPYRHLVFIQMITDAVMAKAGTDRNF